MPKLEVAVFSRPMLCVIPLTRPAHCPTDLVYIVNSLDGVQPLRKISDHIAEVSTAEL